MRIVDPRAFNPELFQHVYLDADESKIVHETDVTLRDLFAAAAMSFLRGREFEKTSEVALSAYDIADSMLEEREKREPFTLDGKETNND